MKTLFFVLAAAMVAAALVFCNPAQPGPYPLPITVVDAFVAAYNRHDVVALRGLITSDAVISLGNERRSGAAVIDQYERLVFARYPKARIEVATRLAMTDLVAETEVIRLTGDQAENGGLSVYRVVHGCIVSVTFNADANME